MKLRTYDFITKLCTNMEHIFLKFYGETILCIMCLTLRLKFLAEYSLKIEIE